MYINQENEKNMNDKVNGRPLTTSTVWQKTAQLKLRKCKTSSKKVLNSTKGLLSDFLSVVRHLEKDHLQYEYVQINSKQKDQREVDDSKCQM